MTEAYGDTPVGAGPFHDGNEKRSPRLPYLPLVHRSLVSDTLTARGLKVRHIMDAEGSEAHRLTPFARAEGGRVTYPGPA